MNTGSMSAKTACDVAVIGGGAAGMMAALQAAWAGARVALLEKNEKLGKKIYITGKGRCNVTNVADIDDFFKQIPRNPRFLNAAARQFTHVTGLLEMLGTPTKVERGGRVFPESDKASDVTRALDRGMRDAGVVISLNTQDSAIASYSAKIGKETDRMLALLSDMLNISKLENSTAAELHPVDVDIREVAEEAADDLKMQAESKKITLYSTYLIGGKENGKLYLMYALCARNGNTSTNW